MTAPNVNQFASIYKRRRPGAPTMLPGSPMPNPQAPGYSPSPVAPQPTGYDLTANNNRNNTAMSSAGAAGATANSDYYNRLQNFDPAASVKQYASSAWDQAVNDPVSGLKRSLADLKGSAVAGGRLDTGFFDQDQGDVINNTTRNFQDTIGKTALEATQMGQNNTAAIGQYGQNQQNQYLDLLTAQREQQTNDARAKAERQRKKKRGIGSFIGTALGAGIGSIIPGVGTAVGATIGGGLGGGF